MSAALLTAITKVDAQVYHRDPAHLWNRLHRAAFVRTSDDGVEFGHDIIDPLLTRNSTHLLEGESHDRLLSALNAFNDAMSRERQGSSLQRAVLQHDLWAIFDWVTARQTGMQWVGRENPSSKRIALRQRLAEALSKLALSAREIEALPDNYADAVASQKYATEYDPNAFARHFLPPDLLQPASTWVELADPAAPVHTTDFGGRSVFRVFVRLPGGRERTIDFLKKLRGVEQKDLFDIAFKPFDQLDVKLPEFPPQTQFALVRQMMVINDKKQIQPTDITQSIQLRVHHDRRDSGAVVGDDMLFHARNLKRAKQDFYEFSLQRKTLFAGEHGGLHPSDHTTTTVISPLRQSGAERDPILNKAGAEIQRRSTVNVVQCVHCHRNPNVYSFESFMQIKRYPERPTSLMPKTENRVGRSALTWKQSQFSWGLFQGLVAGDSR